jgi:hypothetical protein
MRIIAAHAYHRIDYETVWVTLRDDVPRIGEVIRRWRQSEACSCPNTCLNRGQRDCAHGSLPSQGV